MAVALHRLKPAQAVIAFLCLALVASACAFTPAAWAGQDGGGEDSTRFLDSEEQILLELINQSRLAAGVPRLVLDERLVDAAEELAVCLTKQGYDCGLVQDKLQDAGYKYRVLQRKVIRTSPAVSASLIHRALMGNSSLRGDLLDDTFTAAGVAVVKCSAGKYIVEIFAGDKLSWPGSQPAPVPRPEPAPEPQPEPPAKDGQVTDSRAKEMLELLNRERTARGLEPLASDRELNKLARLKAEDMVEKGYFSHSSPTYGSPFDMLKKAGINYRYAGENLAKAPSVSSAHRALMQSPGHRANILNDKFNRVGIGVVEKGYYIYFVQLFTGGSSNSAPAPVPSPAPDPKPAPLPDRGDDGTSIAGLTRDEQAMLSLVNRERAARGIKQLKPNLQLTKIARLKARDMIAKGYFSHTSPTYGSPFAMLRQFGVSYRTAGENLAGAPTVTMAHENLMNSSGHRRNILNESFSEVGIGIVNGGPYGKMFVQLFTG